MGVYKRAARGRWREHEEHRVHNLITTVGLVAWAYNLVNTDGQVINRLAIGDDNTAPVLGDTAMGNQLAIYSLPKIFVSYDSIIVTFWLIGASRDTEDTNTIKEIGLFTTNSGATPSSNKLVCRAVVPDVPVDTDTAIVLVWNLTVGHTQVDAGGTVSLMTDYGKKWMAGRMANLSFEAILDQMIFGGFTTRINPREDEKLTVEGLRKATTWTASGAAVTCSGTVTNAELAANIEQMGAAVGSAANIKTISQEINGSIGCDITISGTCNFTGSISLANV